MGAPRLQSSPARVLAHVPDLRPGDAAVVLARAGVGLSAMLAHLGLEALEQGGGVVSVSFDRPASALPELARALAPSVGSVANVRGMDRWKTFPAAPYAASAAVDGAALAGEVVKVAAQVAARVILVEGAAWRRGGVDALGRLAAAARDVGAVLWVAAETQLRLAAREPAGLLETDDLGTLGPVAGIYLEPRGPSVGVWGLAPGATGALQGAIAPDLLVDERTLTDAGGEVILPASAFTLLAGGAPGAEEEFGKLAEAHGVAERTFTFAGRDVARARGRVVLSPKALALADVAGTYAAARTARVYPATVDFKHLLEALWHQTSTASEVFVIGAVQQDGSVKGGTGWVAELAKLWKRPLHVFDQAAGTWLVWTGAQFEPVSPPKITRPRFAGTGTRLLNDAGRAAIQELFTRSFARTLRAEAPLTS